MLKKQTVHERWLGGNESNHTRIMDLDVVYKINLLQKKKKKNYILAREAAKKILFLMAVPLKGEFTFRHIHFVLLPLLGD